MTAKLANPGMTVLAAGGDGDGLGIGEGHFVAAGRRNIDMTYIIFDASLYIEKKELFFPIINSYIHVHDVSTQ